MNIKQRLKSKATRTLLPLPFQCRHMEYSTISSMDDQPGSPNERLFEISLAAIDHARGVDLRGVSQRMKAPPYYPDVWPGEHYKLLCGLIHAVKPRRVIEIGTFQGLSALAMLQALPPTSDLITLDVVPWAQIPTTVLKESDFADGRLTQVIADVSVRSAFDAFSPSFNSCDLLFIDAPKNVIFERTLLSYLESAGLPAGALVVFDDIRQWNMLRIWHDIGRPKLDLTSFGHWTGTGIIEWSRP